MNRISSKLDLLLLSLAPQTRRS
ncbi:hypothetical protein FJD32_002560 [Shewanella sp. LC6]|uniref:Uncharacterized protein n=2 Tax=Shewanella TaxID=22 RepID=A0A5B8R3K3_9GAMM|nr:hypothetical protein CEQ32_22950 [Shewanella sp. FDAARGOS_354]MDG5901584.1 hypothetical protein [Shewanella xiamenensis]PZP29772.1 MAG: hypothetical protein DI594_16720 [Shewanella oneidensis]QQK62095.1 hypothetical protein FJD32_002560 [Shewanella sp. LC6]TPE54254.1 hypothetical protein FJD33_17725 [Shewanella sp. LC2]